MSLLYSYLFEQSLFTTQTEIHLVLSYGSLPLTKNKTSKNKLLLFSFLERRLFFNETMQTEWKLRNIFDMNKSLQEIKRNTMNQIPIKLVYIEWFNSKENGSGNVIDFMKRSLAGFDGIIVRRNINYMFLNGLVIVFLIL